MHPYMSAPDGYATDAANVGVTCVSAVGSYASASALRDTCDYSTIVNTAV